MLHRHSTEPIEFVLPPYQQGGTLVHRRGQITDWSHSQAMKAFILNLLELPYAPDDSTPLTESVVRPYPRPTLYATMNRLVDADGRILAVRGVGAGELNDTEWAAKLAELAADEAVDAYYQYELFRKWCTEPQVIDRLLAGFVLQAYAPPA